MIQGLFRNNYIKELEFQGFWFTFQGLKLTGLELKVTMTAQKA